MEVINVRLVQEKDTQKFYELSKPIRYGKDMLGIVDLNKKLSEEYPNVKNDFRGQFSKECKILCVSDAFSHTERLVFVGHKVNGTYHRSRTVVCGKYTMMIHGGDPKSVYDVEVYLRYLGMLNNAKLTLDK